MRTLVLGSEGLLLEPLVEELTAQLSEPAGELFVLGHHQYGRAAALGGDPGAMDFGLGGAEYLKLTERIERVIVAEPPSRVTLRDPADAVHVRTAREALEFIRAGGGRCQVIHLSSLLVFGSATARVNEGELSVGQSFDNGFEESQALAEQTIRRVAALGAPLAVVRIAPLVGDAQKNVLDRSSPLFELLELLRGTGLRPGASWTDRPVHFETYNHAAHVLARLTAAGGTRTAHVVRPAPPTDRELCAWLAEKFDLRRLREDGIGSLIRRPPLLNLRAPERRAVCGWNLAFSTTEAEALGLMDSSPWAQVLTRVLASELASTAGDHPAHG